MANDNSNLQNDLGKILGWIQTKKEESQKSGASWGWIFSALASVIVFISLAFVAYNSWKKGKEIANLKHQIDVEEEAKKMMESSKQISSCSDRIRQLKDQILDKNKNIEEIKIQIITLEKERKIEHEKINKITNWEDVDKLVGRQK